MSLYGDNIYTGLRSCHIHGGGTVILQFVNLRCQVDFMECLLIVSM